DLGDPQQIEELWGVLDPYLDRIVGVVHLAAHYDFTNRDDPRYLRLSEAMPTLLSKIATTLAPGAPLVYASSMAAMAPTEPGEPLKPDSPKLGAWAYPKYKIEAEKNLHQAELPQPVVELVLAGVYSDLCELVPLYQQIERVGRRSIESYFYPGDTERGLTYVHIEDAARAFRLALEAFTGSGGTHRFLIGQHAPVTYKAIHVATSQAFHGRVLPMFPMPKALALVGALFLNALAWTLGRRRFLQPWMIQFAGEHFEFDLSDTQKELGWAPERTLQDDLERILQVAVYHRNLWREVNDERPW
ncbi:MAG: NAD(P)-dependent oxidoreductase, partial [Myxococcota bacterium]